jgi:hypothetical protein
MVLLRHRVHLRGLSLKTKEKSLHEEEDSQKAMGPDRQGGVQREREEAVLEGG